tara:strand:+ start:272 stop:526 length:255 start_codon:yes stop_codon:yes gene_type:complete
MNIFNSNNTREEIYEAIILKIPTCPISLETLKIPITLSDGFTYEEESLRLLFKKAPTLKSPVTNLPLKNNNTTRNLLISNLLYS